MRSIYFTLILGCAGVYFLNHQMDFPWWISFVLLFWAFIRLLKEVSAYKERLDELITHSKLERECNVRMELTIDVEEVLKHSSVDHLFNKLKEKGVVSETDKNEWVEKLLSNYKVKYKTDEYLKRVSFDIKSNLVWINENIDFFDTIDHMFDIPFEYADGKQKRRSFSNRIEYGLEIRICVVNGIVKLRIGEFSEEFSPKILDKCRGGPVYQAYETITSFPLIYFPQHGLPERYLNIFFPAADSYHTDKFVDDWRKFQREIDDYNYYCNHPFSSKQTNKIEAIFIDKREAWLNREGFRETDKSSPHATPAELHFYDSRIAYQNRYLLVLVINRDNSSARLYGDLGGYSDYCKKSKF